jgi:hypothetical protein
MTFHVANNRGFHLDLPNGYTVSVMFGYGNYCENHSNDDLRRAMVHDRDLEGVSSSTAEVAAWTTDNYDAPWLRVEGFHDGDDVVGYLSVDRVLEFVNTVSSFASPVETLKVVS